MPRAVVVVEAMAAITIADALLMNMGARMDRITDFYKKINKISRKPINKGKSRVYTGKDGDFTTNLLLFKSLAIMNM